MTAALARRPADFYSFLLVALIALAFAMEATFVLGLAGGGLAPPAPELVRQGPVPCVNG